MKKTPQSRLGGPIKRDKDPFKNKTERREFTRALTQWQKTLSQWAAALDTARKLPVIASALLLAGCQTLSHPNTGPEVADKFWNSYPYFNQPVYPQPVYYPLPDYGVSRNDFIIATDGGF